MTIPSFPATEDFWVESKWPMAVGFLIMTLSGLLVLWGYLTSSPWMLLSATPWLTASFALIAIRSSLQFWGWLLGAGWLSLTFAGLGWISSASPPWASGHEPRVFVLFLIGCWIVPFLCSSLLYALNFDRENRDPSPPH